MQFAGQRTDMQMKPIGEPFNVLIKMTDEIVPEPDAIMITGITPQATIADGITEAEFLRLFHEQIATPGTIFVGYNSVRFDDEFMRFLQYRNFYDAYEWQYTDGKSRWDLLDVVRMTRALRPDGIEWPVDDKGQPTNRLELLSVANDIEHTSAHDALSDVHAVIALAKLIQDKQPKLFEYLLKMRDKKAVESLVTASQPFLYSSGKYANESQKTAVVAALAKHPKRQGSLVFDLRYDPQPFMEMSVSELVEAWRRRWDEPGVRLPVKTLQYNKCPAVAPISVLDEASAKRLQIDLAKSQEHLAVLKRGNFAPKLLEALDVLEKAQELKYIKEEKDVDSQLYDGFVGDQDRTQMRMVRVADASELADFETVLKDGRLKSLLPLYKARNFRNSLSDEERTAWEKFREERLLGGKDTSRLAKFFNRLAELAKDPNISSEKQYLLEELQLYGQSIMPVIDEV